MNPQMMLVKWLVIGDSVFLGNGYRMVDKVEKLAQNIRITFIDGTINDTHGDTTVLIA